MEEIITKIKKISLKYADYLEKVSLFGSRARGDHDPVSDFDLLVWFKGEQNSAVLSELEDIPTLFKLDITVFHDGLSAQFLEEVKQDEVILFMGKFHHKRELLEKAVRKLQETNEYEVNHPLTEQEIEFLRDSYIKRFEFCFELSWKTLKEYLKESGLSPENTPRAILKQAFQVGVIEEQSAWLSMIADRNQTSHEYNESHVIEIKERIVALYLPCFVGLLARLEELETL